LTRESAARLSRVEFAGMETGPEAPSLKETKMYQSALARERSRTTGGIKRGKS
jgi:hypothetical protein